jgi:hypothetical protein
MVRCVNRLRGCLGRVETRGKDYKYEFNEIINDILYTIPATRPVSKGEG